MRRDLMRLEGLVYFYRWRLRLHAVQELMAGVGVAVAVALVFAVTVASRSITSSASAVAHAVVGPAQLQLHARGPDGFSEQLLSRVEHLAGVRQAAPLLEETASIEAADGSQAAVTVAGTDISLAILDGLAHTLPVTALSPGGIGLSTATANALGVSSYGPHAQVRLMLRGHARSLKVSAVLGREAAGALSQAQVAVMPLGQLQQFAGLPGRVSRILVQAQPGRVAVVERELRRLAGGRLAVAPADQDVSLLHQALGPSNQASDLFAGLAGLLGFLFAFNAILLTVPERRMAIADLLMDGAKRRAVQQMVIFQACSLGIVASLVGLLGGYALARGLFHESPGYLTKAFTLGTSTTVGPVPILVSLGGGVLATCLASLVPVWDLRKGRRLDADSAPRSRGTQASTQRWLAVFAAGLLLLASGLFMLVPAAAIFACVLLALTTVIAVPLMLGAALRIAEAISVRNSKLTALPLAVSSLKSTTLRSVALAATGAVALFGSVALGASRDDLLRGIDAYTTHYSDSADVWLVNPADHQATSDFSVGDLQSRVARVRGVASVEAFLGSYLDYGKRRAWVIAWPASSGFGLLQGQILHGSQAVAIRQLGAGDAITVSAQIAAEHHVKVGDELTLPTPTGAARFKVVATTTNFGWSPGAILMSASAYSHTWASSTPSALGVTVAAGTHARTVIEAIKRELGAGSGLEVLTAASREAAIDRSASEGLAQLGEISMLLVMAAILAMLAALGSSIWQRRSALAELQLEGARIRQKRLVLLLESSIMLGAGCLTGTVIGIYGQVVIDGYLKHVTGFPVAGVATGARPIEIFALVIVVVLLLASIPGWFASRAPATLALESNG